MAAATPETGENPDDEFARDAREVFGWIGRYLREAEAYPVLSRKRPGEIRAALPVEAPVESTPFSEILADFEDLIVPGVTHWNHPGFFAYFATSGSAPGILAEALTAALNVNAMLWRTSPAATELEQTSLDWLRRMLGLPETFRGHIEDTASTSTLVAIASAREAVAPHLRRVGLAAANQRLRLYCSEEGHSSIVKAAVILGLGMDGVRRIGTDESFRLRAELLQAAIEEDLAAGIVPFCVVATIGTTSTTSVDPVPAIADLCERYRLWLHVDAAYAGAAAVLPEARARMTGWERADSIVVNPHKWMFVPLDCSALYLRRPEVTRRALSIVPEYLTTPEDAVVENLMDYGPALGRRFRALKLWMVLRCYGQRGIADRLREHVRLANLFAGWVGEDPEWELAAPVPFSTVCFRHRSERNAEILERVNQSGEAFLSHTVLRGTYTLRLAIGNLRTEERHVARAWEKLREAASAG